MKRALPLCFALCLVLAVPAAAQAPEAVDARVAAALATAPAGTRIGLLVVDADGRELVAVRPDDRFVPASNTKIFTTATAFAMLGDLTRPDIEGGASVRIEGRDVVLAGHGDARLSSAAGCTVDCLATLADAVAAKTRVVRDVIGDDSWFPDLRWSPGMSWNTIQTRSGTGVSALTLDDNELPITVTPAATLGAAPRVTASPYYTVENAAITVAGGATAIGFERAPNRPVLRITGTIARGAAPLRDRLGIDDPAEYAAWTFRALLRARGVTVSGHATARHRPPSPGDDPARRGGAAIAHPPEPPALARLVPPPLAEDVRITNKTSQNLHAELLLRRIGRVRGGGAIADGQAAVRGMLAEAGVARAAFDLYDGSGMSTYNRVSPRGMVALLRWISGQRWGAAWRETLPVGGADGTLARRFAGTPLDHRLFAKTGSLNATSALSGWLIARSGRTLTFALFANDIPEGASATPAIDAALEAVAAAN
ncbi:D-alanyl-D-alanine carboxypeptidase/D-alanyl-D-alanine-endopeptidase [Sphingomonas sp. NFR15]|uniref:D-alanyl-D-alanine carboxypeptidase/D-alanyl-D-alanine endopeptidase n=1 Tax=Sphingomonas sp. NFR15 TaxID=1566282 RepID=UPI00088F3FDE|nr:D-alanyl-D-alanine carboxypeptidase/D-alanyl-D-alanine-endopeptidase [Sphingomonas sp. NFR15]SDA34087.1 D-alanyl-D-alanine carboxypeptidase / D-alanyl-D-alanine-endopeptidase (penicillin-binding protein 4) [Sphingomonas sp. NFR15]